MIEMLSLVVNHPALKFSLSNKWLDCHMGRMCLIKVESFAVSKLRIKCNVTTVFSSRKVNSNFKLQKTGDFTVQTFKSFFDEKRICGLVVAMC